MDAELAIIRVQIETTIREEILKAIEEMKDMDRIFWGMGITATYIDITEHFKKVYYKLIISGVTPDFTQQEFMDMLDEVSQKVYYEFIEPPIG